MASAVRRVFREVMSDSGYTSWEGGRPTRCPNCSSRFCAECQWAYAGKRGDGEFDVVDGRIVMQIGDRPYCGHEWPTLSVRKPPFFGGGNETS